MDPRISSWRATAPPTKTEEVLADRYAQLMKWGELLARGDRTTAREIVHDLCVQLSLTQPDFSRIENPDGYLYTCLRHLYLSRLERSSREAVRVISIADCDSLQFAMDADHRVDSLDVQNVLRRICSYSSWRKEQAKGFSYFVLHFFHGYFHREIAALACLPVAAIYNKLKAARTELKAHLEAPEKLRFSNRENPPDADESWSTVSSPDLFGELRQMILAARLGACLPEEELLSHYQCERPIPIPCSLLAHIVSCERCLETIDRHLGRPTLKDRDSLDGLDRSHDIRGGGTSGAQTILRSLHRRRLRTFEHRPESLSIAVNGRIAAFHEVQGESSLLSARIEQPETTHFVEVFSEQNVRLAMLSAEDRPPDGPQSLTQRTILSDDRWLELQIEFDGLGLNSQVSYFDPALSPAQDFEEVDEAAPLPLRATTAAAAPKKLRTRLVEFASALASFVRKMGTSSVLGWALAMVCVLACSSYWFYRMRKQPPTAQAILTRSIEAETASLAGETEHQELAIEETAADGHSIAHGTVDLWKQNGARRFIRRLYGNRHQLIAEVWQTKDGKVGSWEAKPEQAISAADRQLIANSAWTQDLSSRAFGLMAGHSVHLTTTAEGYELTAPIHDDGRPQLLSATLMIDRHFETVGEVLKVRRGSAVGTVRLVQTGFVIEPDSAVPDSVFAPESLSSAERQEPRSSIAPPFDTQFSNSGDTRLAALEIGVLYQLNKLGMDTGEPIEVVRTAGQRIRVAGTVSDETRRHAVEDALRSVPDYPALEVQLTDQTEARPSAANAQPSTVYNVVEKPPLAETVLHSYFEKHVPSGESIDAAVMEFETSALAQAQRALQDAYALNRLGSQFTAAELRSVDPMARRQWTSMVASHSAALQTELRDLRGKYAEIGFAGAENPVASPGLIEDPSEFANAARHLLKSTQQLNQDAGLAFASGSGPAATMKADQILSSAATSIPLPQATEVSELAMRLTDGGGPAAGRSTHAQNRSSTPKISHN